MAESETFFIFYQVGIDCWVPTYLPAYFGRTRRQRRSFLSTFKVCRIANALAHDNLIRRIKLFLTDGKKIRSVVNSNPFSEFPFAPGIFQWDEPNKRLPFISQPKFPGICGKW